MNIRASVKDHHHRPKRLAYRPRARVQAQVETVFGTVDGALGTHVKGLGGVVDGATVAAGGEGQWWLWSAKAQGTDGGLGKGDFLPVGDVVCGGVGALKGAVVEAGDKILGGDKAWYEGKEEEEEQERKPRQ